jgi:hypothetical protein
MNGDICQASDLDFIAHMWTSEHGADNTVEYFFQWGVKQMLGKKSNKVLPPFLFTCRRLVQK